VVVSSDAQRCRPIGLPVPANATVPQWRAGCYAGGQGGVTQGLNKNAANSKVWASKLCAREHDQRRRLRGAAAV
jgi:hypothetical protein